MIILIQTKRKQWAFIGKNEGNRDIADALLLLRSKYLRKNPGRLESFLRMASDEWNVFVKKLYRRMDSRPEE